MAFLTLAVLTHEQFKEIWPKIIQTPEHCTTHRSYTAFLFDFAS